MCKQQYILKKLSALQKAAAIKSTSLSRPKSPTGIAKSTSPISRIAQKRCRRLKDGITVDESGSHGCSA
jgi:hypothetical protein